MAVIERPTRWCFVGENRSRTAVRMGVTWEDGRLCAGTLHSALREIGLEPSEQKYINLWPDDDKEGPPLITRIVEVQQCGLPVVALGMHVRHTLARHGIPHRTLTHPAARGKIRATQTYRLHVADVLGRLVAIS
jgi:hypothetical protein